MISDRGTHFSSIALRLPQPLLPYNLPTLNFYTGCLHQPFKMNDQFFIRFQSSIILLFVSIFSFISANFPPLFWSRSEIWLPKFLFGKRSSEGGENE